MKQLDAQHTFQGRPVHDFRHVWWHRTVDGCGVWWATVSDDDPFSAGVRWDPPPAVADFEDAIRLVGGCPRSLYVDAEEIVREGILFPLTTAPPAAWALFDPARQLIRDTDLPVDLVTRETAARLRAQKRAERLRWLISECRGTLPLDEVRIRVEEQVQDSAVLGAQQGQPVSCPAEVGCWGCCRGQVLVHAEEVDRILPLLDEAVLRRVLRMRRALRERPRQTVCPLLDPETLGCSIYAERPLACRAYTAVTPVDHCYPERAGKRKVAAMTPPILLLSHIDQVLGRRRQILADVLIEQALVAARDGELLDGAEEFDGLREFPVSEESTIPLELPDGSSAALTLLGTLPEDAGTAGDEE